MPEPLDLLAGDIGATKIDVAVVSSQRGAREPRRAATYRVNDYPSLAALLEAYLAGVDEKPVAACFGVAGPVIDGRVQMVNHPWLVDAQALSRKFGFRKVWLLNDLRATAYAVPRLPDDELEIINTGEPKAEGNIAVIAPGTGLGMGYLTWQGGRIQAHATEGGHSDFAPRGSLQRELLAYLEEQRTQVSVEDVCSGLGIPNIYAFLKARGHAEEPDWLAQRLAAADDPTPVIVESAGGEEKTAEISKMVLDIFVSILASEAANLALKIGALGGVFIGGGIPPRILPRLKSKHFLEAYLSKTKYTEYMQRIPVKVILNPDTALLGAAEFGLERLEAAQD